MNCLFAFSVCFPGKSLHSNSETTAHMRVQPGNRAGELWNSMGLTMLVPLGAHNGKYFEKSCPPEVKWVTSFGFGKRLRASLAARILGISCRRILNKGHPLCDIIPQCLLLFSTMHDASRPTSHSCWEIFAWICLLLKEPTPSLAMSFLLLLLCAPGLQQTLWGFENMHTQRSCRALAESNQGWKQPRRQPERRETSSRFAEQRSKQRGWDTS